LPNQAEAEIFSIVRRITFYDVDLAQESGRGDVVGAYALQSVDEPMAAEGRVGHRFRRRGEAQ
jgi:hypothetical protein